MDETIYIPARVRFEAAPAQSDIDVILEKINRHTLEPLKAEEVFNFSGICSNDGMDSYSTRMDPATTLVNYEQNLKAGTPLLEGHNVSKDPYGRSYDGALLAASTPNATQEVRGDWFIVRDLEVNNKNTNHAIRAIKAGILRDLSVGFGGNRAWYRCSSCGNDLMNYMECEHFPGEKDENGNQVFAWIVDAELREVSTVYKGATPGAYINKARAFAQQGELTQVRSAALEQAYGIELNEQKRFYFANGGKAQMNIIEQIRAAIKDGTLEKGKAYEALAAEGETFRQADDVQLRNELGEAATIDGIKKLKAEAEHGRAYVTDLVSRAVAARTKIQGESFNAENYKGMLERSADIEFIKSEAESFEKQAKEKFGGGRQTEDETFGEPNEKGINDTTGRSDEFEDENIFAK